MNAGQRTQRVCAAILDLSRAADSHDDVALAATLAAALATSSWATVRGRLSDRSVVSTPGTPREASLIDKGDLEVLVDRVFPFEQVVDAFAYLEQGHANGKVIAQMVDE